jgi:hypothetical protein
MSNYQCSFCGDLIKDQASECIPLQIILGKAETQTIYAHAFCLRRNLHRSVPLLLKSEIEIYVSLLNEGTEVWRPARAVPLTDEIHLLSPDQEVPTDEEWQFMPGQVVYCKRRKLSDGEIEIVAISLCEDIFENKGKP